MTNTGDFDEFAEVTEKDTIIPDPQAARRRVGLDREWLIIDWSRREFAREGIEYRL
jgi:hypothetical protein